MRPIRIFAVLAVLAVLLGVSGCVPPAEELPPAANAGMLGTWENVEDGSTLVIEDRWIFHAGPGVESTATAIRYATPDGDSLNVAMEGWARPEQNQRTAEAEKWIPELVDEVEGVIPFLIENDTMKLDASDCPEDFGILHGTFERVGQPK